MKRHSLLFAAIFSFAAAAATEPAADPVSFAFLREATISQARENTLKTGKLTYRVYDENGKQETVITAWLEKPCRIRLNFFQGNDSFTVGWDGKESPWACDKENGVFPLSDEGKKEFLRDIHFFPVIVPPSPLARELQPDGEEVYDGIDCKIYRAQTNDGDPLSIRLWVSKTNSLVCLVETEEDGVPTTFSLRGYQEINGVKMPTRITITDAEGCRTLRLVAARFDQPLQPALFTRPASFADCAVGPGETIALPSAQKSQSSASQIEIDALKRNIAKLEIDLKMEREKIAQMEKIYALNQSSATQILSSDGAVRYRSWRYYSRHYSVGYRRNRIAARRLESQNKKIAKEYRSSLRKVTRLEMQLHDAREKLQKLTGK